MNGDRSNENNLISTTDCLEAVGVFKAWKNFLFVIAVLCLLLLQLSFWFVTTGYIKAEQKPADNQPVAAGQTTGSIEQPVKQIVAGVNDVTAVAKDANENLAMTQTEPNLAQQAESQRPSFKIQIKHLMWSMRMLNFVLVPVSILYCLCMLIILQISFTGRLGGMNHVSRAFFLSLTAAVLLMPWQKLFGGVFVGVICAPAELLASYDALKTKDLLGQVFYYARFVGLWLVALLLLVFAQIRSYRWSRTILRRLELV